MSKKPSERLTEEGGGFAPPFFLQTPLQQHRAHRKPSAHRSQQHQVPSLDALVRARIGERERDRRGRGVAVLVEVDDDLLRIDAEPIGRGFDDAAVRLVRDEEIDVGVDSDPSAVLMTRSGLHERPLAVTVVTDLASAAGPRWTQGQSLALALRRGTEPPAKPIIFELFDGRAAEMGVIDGGWGLTLKTEDAQRSTWSWKAQLFDTSTDPECRKPVESLHPDVVARLTTTLGEQRREDLALSTQL